MFMASEIKHQAGFLSFLLFKPTLQKGRLLGYQVPLEWLI